jgi:ArsR family transcriptional regulator, arsenate/arsenite/antimonite-responsive transcriptional repressor
MREKIEIFKVLSEMNRVRILMMLMQKSLCVCEMTYILELTTATVSNHLSYLRQNGFIEDEKDGKWINYKIIKNSTDPIVMNIINFLPEWFDNESVIAEDKKKVLTVDRHNICGNDNKDKKENKL